MIKSKREPLLSDCEDHFIIPVRPCFDSVMNVISCMRHFPKSEFTLCCLQTNDTYGKEKQIENTFQMFNKTYNRQCEKKTEKHKSRLYGLCDLFFLRTGLIDLTKDVPGRILPFNHDDDIDLNDFNMEMYVTMDIMVSHNDFNLMSHTHSLIWDSIVFPLKSMPYIYHFCDARQCRTEQQEKAASSNPLSFIFDDLKYDKNSGCFVHPCVKNIEFVLDCLREWEPDCMWLQKDKIEKMQAKKKKQLLEKDQNVQVVYDL